MIKKVERTSIACWSPATEPEPLLALGTAAGALDASFSSKTELEIVSIELQSQTKETKTLATVGCNARMNRITWSDSIIACGKENGEVDLWNHHKVLKGDNKYLLRAANHSGPVRGLHFNPTEKHLLASGATDGEILIWDMNEPSKPYAPGARSQRLEDVTCLAWNKVGHILASGSSNGYTVVWDLRNRKELIKIPYPGGRKPVTSIAWNPDKPTQMVTCSDDDQSPVILVWDLRNASAAEMTLHGHSKGILSMDWCSKDSDLLLSCGKDNRTIVWDTTLGQPIGDLAHSANWSFDVKWCPLIPDLCVVASYDGLVSVHSIQNSGDQVEEDVFSPQTPHVQPEIDHNDPFSAIAQQDHRPGRVQQPVFKLQKPPKWLRKPVGAVWGFGGQLASFCASAKSAVTIKHVPVNEEVSFRTDQLDYILKEDNPEVTAQYCDYMSRAEFIHDPKEKEMWKFLKTLFSANSRDDMIDFLGFDPTFESNERLAALMKKLNVSTKPPDLEGEEEKEERSPKLNESALPLQLFSNRTSEDGDIDTLITKAIILGDFELAVKVCVGANRMADALVLAVNGGPDLLQKTQDEYFKKYSKTKSYARVLQSVVIGDLTDVIRHTKIEGDAWKDLVALICTYSRPEDYAHYFSILGERLSGISSFSHAASLCFVGSGDFEKVVHSWCPSVVKDIPNVENLPLVGLVERVAVFRQAIRYVDPSLALEHTEETFKLKDLYNAYVEYAWIASLHGKIEVAWRFLEQVPIDFIPSVSIPVDIFVLRDQVYSSKNLTLGVTGRPPAFPFEIVDVVNLEAQQRAEKARLEQLAHSKPTFQPSAPSYGGYQAQNQWQQPPQQQNQWQQNWQQPGNQANQWQQPPTQQWNQPAPPTNTWSASSTPMPPQSNNWSTSSSSLPFVPPPVSSWNSQNQPPPATQQQPIAPFVPPPVSSWNTPNQVSSVGQAQPGIQPFVPPPPQKSWNAPTTAGSTGHAPPMPSTYFQAPPVHQVQGQQPPSFSQPAAIPPPPIVSEPSKPDRSLIKNPVDKECYESLSKLWEKVYSLTKNAQDKRTLEEGEKKLEVLYDQMTEQQVSANIVQELLQVCKALEKSDFGTAHRIQHDLMTKKFEQVGLWIVGVKKLVDGLERASKPIASPMNSVPNQPSTLAGTNTYGSNQSFGPPPVQGFQRGANLDSSSSQSIQGYQVPPPTQGYANLPPPPTQSFAQSHGAPPVQQQQMPPPPIPSFGVQQQQQMPPTHSSFGQSTTAPPQGFQSNMPAPPPTQSFRQTGPPPTQGFNQAPPPMMMDQKQNQPGPPPTQGFNQPQGSLQRKPSSVLNQSAGTLPQQQNTSTNLAPPPTNIPSQQSSPLRKPSTGPPPVSSNGPTSPPKGMTLPPQQGNVRPPQQIRPPQPQQGFNRPPPPAGFNSSANPPPSGLQQPPPMHHQQRPPVSSNNPPPTGVMPPPGQQRPHQQFARPPPPTGPFGQ